MSLSSKAVRELQRELVHLEQARVDLNTRINAINALVGDAKSATGTDRPALALRPSNSTVKGTRDSSRKVPFHAAILRTVTATPGLKPRQVTDVMRKAGYSSRRKTGLNARVYNTMYDMYKRGVLKKTSDGRYAADPSNDSGTSRHTPSEDKLIKSVNEANSPVPA